MRLAAAWKQDAVSVGPMSLLDGGDVGCEAAFARKGRLRSDRAGVRSAGPDRRPDIAAGEPGVPCTRTGASPDGASRTGLAAGVKGCGSALAGAARR